MSDSLPKDPIMLLSFTNTQLRDHYHTLTEFCKYYMVNETELIKKLHSVDYQYDAAINQFV